MQIGGNKLTFREILEISDVRWIACHVVIMHMNGPSDGNQYSPEKTEQRLQKLVRGAFAAPNAVEKHPAKAVQESTIARQACTKMAYALDDASGQIQRSVPQRLKCSHPAD
jgi:hypothetical protein